jgi:ureidoglycolate lyase
MAASISSHDNQSSLNLSAPPSTSGPSGLRTHTVPLVRASASALQGFGHPISDFASCGCAITPWPVAGWRKLVPGTGDEGGTVEDVFTMERVGCLQLANNVGLGRRYVTGWYHSDPAAASEQQEPASTSFLLTHEANYHPDGAQVFSSRNGEPFILLLARPGDDIAPESFTAFLVDPAHDASIVGVHVDAGVWHQPAFPVHGRGVPLLDNRQGKVHACVAVDFVSEWKCYLRVPLCLE